MLDFIDVGRLISLVFLSHPTARLTRVTKNYILYINFFFVTNNNYDDLQL